MAKPLADFVATACTFDPADTLLPLTVDGVLAGWMKKSFAERLEDWPELFAVRPRGVGMLGAFESAEHRSAAISEVIESHATAGIIQGWRNETVSVCETFYSPPLMHVERAATRYFGFTVYGAHLNGLTARNGEPWMWIARRAEDKAVDPGKLDNVVGGRIARGGTPFETLVRECAEEAGMAPELARLAKGAGALRCKREVEEGLHNEIIFVHDLILPESFIPKNTDGEVAGFECVPIVELLGMLETRPEDFTVDAAMVALDCLIRRGYLSSDREDYLDIIHALRP